MDATYSEFFLLFTSTFLILFTLIKFLEWKKMPPGPYGLPILGYFPFLIKKPQKVFMELQKQYGKYFSLNILINPCLIINDWDTAKKILKHPATFARPNNFEHLIPGRGGFFNDSGEEWIKNRRYSISAMKALGIGRGKWEILVHDEAADFIKEIQGWKGKATDFLNCLEESLSNNNISLFFGKQLSSRYNNKKFKIIQNAVDVLTSVSFSSLITQAPIFVLKILRKANVAHIVEFFDAVEGYEFIVRDEINKSLTSSESEEKETTFINFYIEEIMKENYNKEEFNKRIERIVGDVTILYVAGYDSTKASLQWLLLLIASHSEVQEKVYQEIDNIFGNQQLIYWEDRNKLPYTMATINEALRWVATVPLFPPRRTIEAMKFDDYTIPKGTIIMTNGWAMMRDQTYHQDAENFQPERFLSNSENQNEKVKSFIPFSTGKRNCPGEQIAMMSLFLYFTHLIQKFRIICPDGKSSAMLEDNESEVIRHALPQKLCFIER